MIFFGSKTYEAFHFRTVFKQDQCRNADNTELAGQLHLFIHINFADLNIRYLLFKLMKNRCHHLTRAAPYSPEIYQYRFVGFCNLCLKIFCC